MNKTEILNKFLRQQITVDNVITTLNLNNSHRNYLLQELDNVRFGDSSINEAVNRLNQFI